MLSEPSAAESCGDDILDERLLSEYWRQLKVIRYRPVGVVETLVLSPRMDEHSYVASLTLVPGEGPVGQYPGKLWWRGERTVGRQVSAVNAEVLDALDIPYDVPGDNLVISGIDLATFEPDDILRVGDVLLTATSTPHRPCAKLARRTSLTKMKAIAAARYRGTMFDALRQGTIRAGDTVERLLISLL